MAMIHVLHNNHQQSHYDCTLGWKIDAASRTLVIHKPGGRWHIPLDNVVSIEIEHAAGEHSREPIDLLLNKRNLQMEVELKTALDDLEHFKDWSNTIADRMTEDYDGEEAQEHLIDGWLTDIEQHMHDNDHEAWARFFSGRHTVQKAKTQDADVSDSNRPHSRACGIRGHDHGIQCSKDCPTCGGKRAWLPHTHRVGRHTVACAQSSSLTCICEQPEFLPLETEDE